MKRLTFAALTAALIATIAFAEVVPRHDPGKTPEPGRSYRPSGADATGGFAAGAFTVPPR